MAATRISDDRRRQAFEYFARHPSVPVGAIATFLGISRYRLWQLRAEWGWPSRQDAVAAAQGESRAGIPTGPGASLRDAAAALALVTRKKLDALIRVQTVSPDADADTDHDKTARVLSAYAKTLTIAHSLMEREGTACHDDGADGVEPRSLHDLRDELARHLERIVAEEQAGGGDGLLV